MKSCRTSALRQQTRSLLQTIILSESLSTSSSNTSVVPTFPFSGNAFWKSKLSIPQLSVANGVFHVYSLFHNVAKIFHNVAKIFHNVENLYITSISAPSSSADVVNDVRSTTAVGRHSVQHRYIVTTNMRRTETNVNRTTHDGSDMTFGWSATKRNIYMC